MKREPVFDIELSSYFVYPLVPDDALILQRLFEKCGDYFLIVDGEGPSPEAAEEEFVAGPPGRTLDDKFIFGIFDEKMNLTGYLEGFINYPEPGTWWIGSLLIAPDMRSKQMGMKVLYGFLKYAADNDAVSIALGVVEENKRAFEFWGKAGFELSHTTEPRQFSNKIQVVNVMRKSLIQAYNNQSMHNV